MTPQEADIIKDVFAKLKAMSAGATDAEAAGLVDAQLKADRGAGLALVQVLVMTDRERAALAQENDTLKQKIQALEAQSTQSQQAPSGGLFGGARVPQTAAPWGQQQAAPPPVPPPLPPQSGPWGGGPSAGPWGGGQPSSGGGFLSSALRTGAGVAGGLLAVDALRGLFGGGHGAQAGGMGLFGQQPTTVINETNIYEGDRFAGGPSPTAPAGFSSGGYIEDASWDDGGGGFDDDNYA